MRTSLVIAGLTITSIACGTPCPTGMVLAKPGVCIDKYEWPGILGQRPVLAVSGLPELDGVAPIDDAEGVCTVRGMRICTLNEWVAACKGPGGTKYPYGDSYDPTACNTIKLWRAFDARKVWARDSRELQRLDQSAPVGSFSRCVSAAGAYDMVGNAEEWVRCDEGKYGWCLAGGYWANPHTCTEAIVTHSPNWHLYETGFRCCADLHSVP